VNSVTRLAARYAGATVAAGLLVFALALLLGGGAPPPPPPGLSGAGRIPAWIGDVTTFAARLAGVVAVGLGTFVARPFGRDDLSRPASAAAAGWAALSVLQLGLLAWELDGQAGVFATPVGKALVAQAILAAVAAAGWTVAAEAPGRSLAWPAAAAALLPVVLAGHPRTAAHQWVAGVSVSVHVVAAAVWVGGLVALAWVALTGDGWHALASRYSNVALACAAAVGASGVVAAIGRIDLGDLLTSRYGAIVALKVVALAGLVGAGWLQRRHIIGRGAAVWRGFVALAALELITMTITFALAVALSRTPPPS